MTRHRWYATWRGPAAVAFVVLPVYLLSSAALKGRVDAAAAWTIAFANANPVLGAVLFVLFSAVSAMLAFASSAVFVPPATLVWGTSGAFLLLWGGWTLGASAAWGIGRLMTPLLIRLGYGHKLEKYQAFVSREMGFWPVVLFCIAVPSELPGYLFGGAHYPFLKFLAAVAIAESIYAFALVVIGEHLVTLRPAHVLTGAIVLVAVGALIARLRKKSRP